MKFFREEPKGPIARDWEGNPLTENQVREIIKYLQRVENKQYSQSYLETLREVANKSFQNAIRKNDREKIDAIGTELQVIDHILHVVKARKLKPDPEHLKYLSYLDEQDRLSREAAKAAAVVEETLQDVAQIQVEPIQQVSPFEGLPTDVVAAFYPRSTIPIIARIQDRLERSVRELQMAVEDREPPFIIKRHEQKIAQLHEELEKTKQAFD